MSSNETPPATDNTNHPDTTMTLCRVSGKITNEGMKVGFMYREEPDNGSDSGWRFLSGTETQKYVNDEQNSQITELKVVIELDKAITSYLDRPFGTDLERVEGTDDFQVI
jgi:hypothetical protein